MSITLRNIKGSPLTHEEMDENFSALTSSLGAGDGLTGGGFLTSEVEFNVGQGDGISVTADAVAVNATVARTGSNVFTDDQTISGSLFVSGNLEDVQQIHFDTSDSETLTEGQLGWNSGDGTLNLGLNGGEVTLQIGQENVRYVLNQSGDTIENGSVVYASGTSGNKILIEKYTADNSIDTFRVLGLATEDIANNSSGYVTAFGRVRDLDTSGFGVDDPVYAHPTTAGGITGTEPSPPSQSVFLGFVVESSTSGSVELSIKRNDKSTDILYSNANSTLLASNVGAAIDELDFRKASVDQLTSNITLYATTTASVEFPGYFKLVDNTDDDSFNDVAVDVSTGGITGSSQLIAELAISESVFVGNPGVINVTTLGNIRKTSGGNSQNAVFFFEVYSSSGSVESLIATSNNTEVVNVASYSKFSATALLNNGIFTEDDRIVLKFYGSNDGGGAPVYDFQFGGSDPIRTLFPVPVAVIPSDNASAIQTLTSNFDNILSGADTNVQLALETLDDHSHTLQEITETGNSTTQEIQAGGLNVDSGVLYVNPTNNRVGINTTSPAQALTVVGNISSSGDLFIDGDAEIDGDLTVAGKVTAQEFHTEFVSASIIYESGSTKFGDTLDDIHEFTGSVNLTGSLGVIGTTDLTGKLEVSGDITGSSNIDIAGTVDANVYSINGTTVVDSSRNITGSNGLFTGDVDVANLDSSGNVDANTFSIDGSTVIDASENITGASLDVTGEVEGNSFAINTNTVIDSSQNITGASLDVTGEVEGNTFAVDGTIIVDASRNFTGSNAEFTGDLLVEGNTTLGNADADRVDILGQVIALSGSNTTIEHEAVSGNLRIQTTGGTNNKLILSASGDIEIEQSMTMKNLDTSFQSVGYQSGFAGQGFDINFTSQSSAEFDNLTVRGSMRVFELIINQIRATNGSLFVSSVGKVDDVIDLGGGDYALIFDTGSGTIGHGFTENDVIRAQQVDRNAIAEAGVTQSVEGSLVYRSDLTVTSVQDLKTITASLDPGSTPPSSSFEFVRLGNTTNVNRQGNVYLTSDDNYAPFIDVVDGITDHSDWNNSAVSGGVKVRVGKIDGINSPVFGDLQGYGMWASGSVYLEGSVNATSGLIAGWAIEPGYLQSNNIKLQSSGSAGGELISIGATAGIASNGIFLSGSGEFNLQLDSDNRITQTGGTLDLRAENLVAKGDTVEISGSNFHLLNGNITASNVDLSGNINAETGTIGGFRITDSAITGSSFFLSGSATGNEFFISSSKFNVKANGDVTGSQVLFTGGKITGSAILFDVNDFTAKGDNVEISGSNFHLLNGNITASNVDLSGNINAQTGTIGGFAITDSAITGSSFFLSGSATGNEFFISSSNFNVKANGDLTASNANITGDIVANNITATTAGNIAGWSIGSNTLSSGDVYLSNDTNEKGLYISSSINRLQVGEFNDYVPSPTTLSTGTRTETTSADSKINGYISLDGFFLTSNTGSATDTASIFVPIIGTINQNDTVIVTQPVEFIGYSDRANLGFTYDSFTDSVTVEIVSGSSNTVVASSEAFLRPTPSNLNLPGASKTVQVSFFYTGSQALTSTGDLKAKITNTVDYNRTSTTGTLNRLVDINGLVVKKDTAVVNITNNQAFFYAGENRQFKWTPDELIFKGGELDITDLVVENVFVTSSNTNVIAVQAEDGNQDGLLWGIAANGDPYFAPISKSFYDFDSELRYDQSEERWQFDDELYVNGVLNGTTATFTGDLNAGDISGSTLESSGNTVVKGNLTVIGDTIISGSIDGHPVISPVASDSDSNTNGVVIQNLTVDAFGHLENIGTVDLDNRFVEKAGDTMTGNLILTDKLLSSQNNTDVDTGTEVIATVATATYDAAFFDFVIKKTTNLRAGTVYAIHDGTNVEFTETSTQDLGDTSDVTLSVDISGGNLRLNATTTSNDWSVKALVRGL